MVSTSDNGPRKGGQWIIDCLCNRENMQEARRKSIMPHGDIYKGKISFMQYPLVLQSSIFQHHITLPLALHPSKQIDFKIANFYYLLALVVLSSITKKGWIVRENRPLANLLWILVFDDQHNQIGLMKLQVIVLQFNRIQDVTWTKTT